MSESLGWLGLFAWLAFLSYRSRPKYCCNCGQKLVKMVCGYDSLNGLPEHYKGCPTCSKQAD